jgi:flagellar biosynthesis protein FliP
MEKWNLYQNTPVPHTSIFFSFWYSECPYTFQIAFDDIVTVLSITLVITVIILEVAIPLLPPHKFEPATTLLPKARN